MTGLRWLDRVVAETLPLVPRPIVRRVSARYIAGETLEDAVRVVRDLNREGVSATLDLLGEFVTTPAEAGRAAESYHVALDAIRRERLDSNVSLKLTQMGLKVDPEMCFRLTSGIVERARSQGNFLRLDMEDSTCTDATLAIHRRLRELYPDSVGCVIQAYLKRSAADVRDLITLGARVRLCKGIYVESPEIAYRDPLEINRNFVTLLTDLLEHGVHTGIATHDARLVEAAFDLIRRLGLGHDAYEFQMLLGVREPLRQVIREAGHRIRVYVPFGSHWYAYSLRRLKENPQIAGHVMRAFLNGRS
jgi:proline dehydrogenase